MGRKAKPENTVTPEMSVNNIDNKTAETIQNNTAKTTYVVVRDGYRVEDREYEDPNDPAAISTKEFWTRVSKNMSWGEKVSIVQYDPKKHRVW
jgi:hypothetical protein